MRKPEGIPAAVAWFHEVRRMPQTLRACQAQSMGRRPPGCAPGIPVLDAGGQGHAHPQRVTVDADAGFPVSQVQDGPRHVGGAQESVLRSRLQDLPTARGGGCRPRHARGAGSASRRENRRRRCGVKWTTARGRFRLPWSVYACRMPERRPCRRRISPHCMEGIRCQDNALDTSHCWPAWRSCSSRDRQPPAKRRNPWPSPCMRH